MLEKNKVAISLGSNKGNKEKYLSSARALIQKNVGSISIESSIYETEPWGNKSQPYFLNQAIVIETKFSPIDLFSHLQAIEKSLDRTKTTHWGIRTIDIDILYYNQEIINTKQLVIPHPYISQRRFILVALCEIIPYFEHPLHSQSQHQLLQQCSDNGKVCRLNPSSKL